jgi:hypothetical protein
MRAYSAAKYRSQDHGHDESDIHLGGVRAKLLRGNKVGDKNGAQGETAACAHTLERPQNDADARGRDDTLSGSHTERMQYRTLSQEVDCGHLQLRHGLGGRASAWQHSEQEDRHQDDGLTPEDITQVGRDGNNSWEKMRFSRDTRNEEMAAVLPTQPSWYADKSQLEVSKPPSSRVMATSAVTVIVVSSETRKSMTAMLHARSQWILS